jgi:D-alanyl-D-alanine carboxypeptidase
MVALPQPIKAARTLVDQQFLNSLTNRKRQLQCSRDGLEPAMADFALKFVKECARRGIPMYLHCGVRSLELQAELFHGRYTKARPGQSPHQYGAAVDIVHSVRHWELTRDEWAVVGVIGKEVARAMNLKVEWGGDWKFWDPAHWESKGWRTKYL